MNNDTPRTTAKAIALTRNLSVSDRHRFEEMMIMSANFERRCRVLKEMASRYITDLENVVEGLDPEEAAKLKADRAILDES